VGRVRTWVRVRSAVYQLVRDGLAGLRGSAARTPTRVPDEFRVWRRDYDDETRHAWRITEALLRRLQRGTREIGSELVVLYVPTAVEIHPAIWAATRERYGLSETEWDVTRLARELAGVCSRNGIHFVDPSDAFRAEAARSLVVRRPLYFETDPHWTPAGHALAGHVLAGYVEKDLPRIEAFGRLGLNGVHRTHLADEALEGDRGHEAEDGRGDEDRREGAAAERRQAADGPAPASAPSATHEPLITLW
jgi:hypothetical protein